MDDKEFGTKMYPEATILPIEDGIVTITVSGYLSGLRLRDDETSAHITLLPSEVCALALRYFEVYPAELAQVEAVKRLVEAAKPFVELAKQIVASKDDDDPIWGYRDAGLTYGDFRRIEIAIAKWEAVNDGR